MIYAFSIAATLWLVYRLGLWMSGQSRFVRDIDDGWFFRARSRTGKVRHEIK